MKIEPFNCKRCGVYVSADFIKNKNVRNRKKAWREGICFKRCGGSQKDLGGYPLDPIKRAEYLKQKKEDRKKRRASGDKKQNKKSFYLTPEWMFLRYKALKVYGRQCLLCGAKPPYVVLHVDHIKPRSKYPELELVFDNLQVLCEYCNLGKSNIDETDFRPVKEIKHDPEKYKNLMPKKGALDLPDF